jgi:hypothetical protein
MGIACQWRCRTFTLLGRMFASFLTRGLVRGPYTIKGSPNADLLPTGLLRYCEHHQSCHFSYLRTVSLP